MLEPVLVECNSRFTMRAEHLSCTTTLHHTVNPLFTSLSPPPASLLPSHLSHRSFPLCCPPCAPSWITICTVLQPLSFPASTSNGAAPLFSFQGPKVEGGHASARSMSFDAQSAAAAARSGVPIDLMTVAARVDAGKHSPPTCFV